MKKLIFLFVALLGFAFAAQAQSTILYPFGEATSTTITLDTTMTITPNNSVTFYTLSDTLTYNVTINTVNTRAQKGWVLYITAIADGSNRTVTYGTGIESGVATVTANKTQTAEFVYDGTYYRCVGRVQQN